MHSFNQTAKHDSILSKINSGVLASKELATQR